SAPLIVGDECLGWRGGAIARPMDILETLSIQAWSSAGWFRTEIATSVDRLFHDALAADLVGLLVRSSVAGEDPNDRIDWLYLTERLLRVLAWREAFGGPFASIRQPLLDRDILTFMEGVPGAGRLNNRLFKET